MPRSAASVTWGIVGAVVAILLGLVLLFGPRLYRAMVAPIVDLSKSEEELTTLDRELAFTPPADGRIAEERLEAFLAVRRELLPHYQRWTEATRRLEGQKADSWQAAKEVLALTREVFTAQNTALRSHRMSAAELRWLEEQVYDGWLGRLPALGQAESDRRLRLLTEEDLRFLGELRARHGDSQALAEVDRRLEGRLRTLPAAERPVADEGPNGQLLRQHRGEIEALRFAEYRELHSRLLQRRHHGVTVRLGEEPAQEGVQIDLGRKAAEATPTATR